MKMKKPLLKPLVLATGTWIWCALNLHAQTAPTITQQPVDQVVTNGGTAIFSVSVSGTGPFSYQWRFNGNNIAPFITTVAGNGTGTFAGDGGAATNASLYYSIGVTLDASGNLFIADTFHYRVRKVATNGTISTVAGNGTFGFSGDGSAVTNASLSTLSGVACDAFGNLYIADTANARIRKVGTNGIISTVAGNGIGTFAGDGGAAINASLYGPYGIALDASGNLYIADNYNARIRKMGTNGIISTVAGNGTTTYAGNGGAATNASLNPEGVALDASGNLYIADNHNNRILKVGTNGIITSVAGNGSANYAGDGGAATNASLNVPANVALDIAGNLYIADNYNNRIRKVATNGIISTLAGNGTGGYSGDGNTAAYATIYGPSGVAVDNAGNLFFADYNNSRIREVFTWPASLSSLTFASITTNNIGNYSVIISSSGDSVTSSVATLNIPAYISVQPASQTVLLGRSISFTTMAVGTLPLTFQWTFNGTNLPGATNISYTVTNAALNDAGVYAVTVTNQYGSIASSNATLTVAYISQQPINQTGTNGGTIDFEVLVSAAGPFTYQWQFNGTNLPVSGIIMPVAGNGTSGFSGDGGPALSAALNTAYGTVVDNAGNLYIADKYNHRIRKVATNGIITTIAGKTGSGYSGDGVAATNSTLYYPSGVALDRSGNLFISDTSNNRIRKVNTNGIITTVAGKAGSGYSGDGGVATNALLYSPNSVAVDGVGNLFIADYSNNRIRKVNTNGIITTVAGMTGSGYSSDGGAATNALLYSPEGVALDASGDLYIADAYNNRVRKVDTNGIITTVAGNGTNNFSGDGGAATNATMRYPSGVAVDNAGNLFIADDINYRIRQVWANGIITTAAGNGTITYSDGGSATSAGLYYAQGVTVDSGGNLFIADDYLIHKVVGNPAYPPILPTLLVGNLSATNAGNYAVIIRNASGSITSSVVTLTVQAVPIITVQPASQIGGVGSSVSFSVAAAGSGPFGYLWYFAGTNLVQIGTNSTLVLPGISTNNAGNYTVVITNVYGSVTSQVATLTVALPPTMAIQPASQTNLAGTTVAFNVTAGGIGPFSYQWQFNSTNLPNNIINTVAGNGTHNFSGDGGAATNANLNLPCGVALDASGNLFIADNSNNRIRKVDTHGIITTVAGNGVGAPPTSYGGYCGDGGAAIYANLNYPTRVTFDTSGNLYIADQFNNRIRKVDANGIITTVVGNGTQTYAGDGGPALTSSLHSPCGITFDAFGNLFIADQGNNRIRKVDHNSIITTVAGNGSATYAADGSLAINASLYAPDGVALDAFGNLYIGDSRNNRIRKVGTNGIITTIAGNGSNSYSGDNGPAVNASLDFPQGIAFDALGNLDIADWYNSRIRRMDTNGIITTVAGNGTYSYSGDGGAATNAGFYDPVSISFDVSGNLYIADFANSCIREVHFTGYPTLTFSNVLVNNAGNYSVVITSPYGSVTSVVATLMITIPSTPPQIIASGTNFGFTTNQSGFGFSLNGAFGQTIVVDGSTNLLNWTPLFTNTAGGIPFYFFDPTTTNFPGRFYRARLP
jgi:sugar lactone lactonase YvrE